MRSIDSKVHLAAPLLAGAFTVDDYYRMAEVGILNEDSGVELLDGLVVKLAPTVNPCYGGARSGSTPRR